MIEGVLILKNLFRKDGIKVVRIAIIATVWIRILPDVVA